MSQRQSLGERVLLRLSRRPGSPEPTPTETAPRDDLRLLRTEFEGFDTLVVGHDVADFGCGLGRQAVALALEGARSVVGIDANERYLEKGRLLAEAAGVGDRVRFATAVVPQDHSSCDIVLSQNAMEHFPDPAAALRDMGALLRPTGLLLITFGPLWLSPYGSHMHFFTRVPWVNLLFRERTVMAVRARFRNDGATRYQEVEGGLNRMTVRKFKKLLQESGLHVEWLRCTGVKGLNRLTTIPVFGELLTQSLTCIARRQPPGES